MYTPHFHDYLAMYLVVLKLSGDWKKTYIAFQELSVLWHICKFLLRYKKSTGENYTYPALKKSTKDDHVLAFFYENTYFFRNASLEITGKLVWAVFLLQKLSFYRLYNKIF